MFHKSILIAALIATPATAQVKFGPKGGVASSTSGYPSGGGEPSGGTYSINGQTGAVTAAGKTTIGATGWLETAIPNTETLAQTQSISTGGKIGTLGACRTSDLPLAGAAACLGADGIAINNNTSFIQGAYGHYAEARRYGNAGWTYGMENNVLNGGDTQDETPYSLNQAGITESYRATCGRNDTTLNNPCSAALMVTGNGGQFRRGIVFSYSALDPAGRLEAISLASGYNIAWYTPQNNFAAQVYGGSGTAGTTGQISLVASNSNGVPVTVSLMGYGNNSFAPSSSAIDFGASAYRWGAAYVTSLNLPEVAPASVPVPAAGSQSIYLDSTDHKLKRKDSTGSVTVIG